MHTLMLNADGTPLSILPISAYGWQDAMKFAWPGDAEPLHLYENWVVRSPSIEVQVPAVMMLRQQVPSQRVQSISANPEREMIFLRDNYTCQYCGKVFGARSLTLDHVLPRKYGGKTEWENLSSACEPCNGKRGHDVRIQPRMKPFRPTYYQLLKNAKKRPLTVPHESWTWFLDWPETLVTVVTPRRCEAI